MVIGPGMIPVKANRIFLRPMLQNTVILPDQIIAIA